MFVFFLLNLCFVLVSHSFIHVVFLGNVYVDVALQMNTPIIILVV